MRHFLLPRLGSLFFLLGISLSMGLSQALASLVYVLPIQQEIDASTSSIIRRGVREAIAHHADFLILHMNTNGGRTDAMEEIVRALETFPAQDQTFTYVDKKAASAGAFIAAATHHIYMAPGSVIGAATPILVSAGSHSVQNLPESYEKKITSFFEATGRATAERHGHNPAVFAAMVDREVGLTLHGVEIAPKGTILTLTDREAERTYGLPPQPLLSEGTVPDLNALITRVAGPSTQVVILTPTGLERLGHLLISIAPILLGLGMFLAYLEFKNPGMLVFGILSGLCFLLFFLGSYVAGLSGYEPILLFLVGFILIGIEVFLVPGILLPVVTGLLLVIGSLLYALSGHTPNQGPLPSLAELHYPLEVFFASVALAGIAIVLTRRYLPSAVSTSDLERATVSGAGFDPSAPVVQILVGAEGEALTHLRPAGTARLDQSERPIDVVSEGGFIAPGTRIRVTQIEGIRIVVRAISS